MSSLVFDGDELSLSLLDSSGKRVGSWQASNFGGPKSDIGDPGIDEAYLTFIPDGEYSFRKDCQGRPQKHQDDTADGKYGSLGILVLEDLEFGGQVHTGLGVHAGRASKADTWTISKKPLLQRHGKGPHYRTNGCIRTTEAAMHTIVGVIAKDPLKSLKVKNNGKYPTGKVSGASAPALLRP